MEEADESDQAYNPMVSSVNSMDSRKLGAFGGKQSNLMQEKREKAEKGNKTITSGFEAQILNAIKSNNFFINNTSMNNTSKSHNTFTVSRPSAQQTQTYSVLQHC
jgi:hypothetical protein